MHEERSSRTDAATYVAGFRAALGTHEIDLRHEPAPVGGDVDSMDALYAEPADAASAAFHAPRAEHATLVAELSARRGAHEDAHVAKYTLACFDAAGRDPERVNLYLAAAAYLHRGGGTRLRNRSIRCRRPTPGRSARPAG